MENIPSELSFPITNVIMNSFTSYSMIEQSNEWSCRCKVLLCFLELAMEPSWTPNSYCSKPKLWNSLKISWNGKNFRWANTSQYRYKCFRDRHYELIECIKQNKPTNVIGDDIVHQWLLDSRNLKSQTNMENLICFFSKLIWPIGYVSNRLFIQNFSKFLNNIKSKEKSECQI